LKNNLVEDIFFPQYRKYKNNKSYFKILSLESFEEKYFIGKKIQIRTFHAEQYPEKLFIRDLLINYSDMGTQISASDYEQIS
jgi:hypothetical protein